MTARSQLYHVIHVARCGKILLLVRRCVNITLLITEFERFKWYRARFIHNGNFTAPKKMGSIVCSLASVGTKSEEILNGNHKFFSIKPGSHLRHNDITT